MNNIKLRPSFGPIAKKCPSSMLLVDNEPQIVSPNIAPSTVGTCLHEIFKDLIYPGIAFSNNDLVVYCDKYHLELEGYWGVAWRARAIETKWQKIKQWHKNSQRETLIECTLKNGFVLRGTPDLFYVFGEYAVIFDLKTGFSEIEFIHQLELYALILYKLYGATGLKKVHCAVFAPMIDKYESRTITEEYLIKLEDEYVLSMENAGITYCQGAWCGYCPRLSSCPVSIRAIAPVAEDITSIKEITPADVARMRPVVKAMEKAIDLYKTLERALVVQNGSVDMGNGYELYLQETIRETLNTEPTINYLINEGIDTKRILEHVSITKENIKTLMHYCPKVIKNDRVHGYAKEVARVLKEIREKGFVVENSFQTVKTRPFTKEIT